MELAFRFPFRAQRFLKNEVSRNAENSLLRIFLRPGAVAPLDVPAKTVFGASTARTTLKVPLAVAGEPATAKMPGIRRLMATEVDPDWPMKFAKPDSEKAWRSSGATGFGVRVVLEYLCALT